jgi:tyrosyl-tRNA synthetase
VGTSILDALVSAELASSKREARQFIADKAVSLNDYSVDEKKTVGTEDFQNGVALLRRGKKNLCILVLA